MAGHRRPSGDRYKWVALSNTTPRRVHVGARRLDRHHLAAGDLPRHPPRPAGPGQHQLPAVDDHGLPAGPGGAGGHARPARRHVRPGPASTTPASRSSPSRRSCCRSTRSAAAAAAHVADRLAGAAGRRRLDAHGELGRDPHRRVPGRAARPRARASTRSPRSPGSSSASSPAGCSPRSTGARCSGSTCPSASFGTIWAYRSLRDTGERHPGRDRLVGQRHVRASGWPPSSSPSPTASSPTAATTMGWTNPLVLGGLLGGGLLLLVAFVVIETPGRRADVPARPVPHPGLRGGQRGRLLAAIARGGLQFMLIIWLQGIWLPLHGYDYADTPLWAGIYLLPLTVGFLVAGPVVGLPVRPVRRARLRHRRDARVRRELRRADAAAGRLPVLGVRRCSSRSTGSAAACSPRPTRSRSWAASRPRQRGAASGMRSTFQNSGHGAVDRRVLLADDRRAGQHPAAHAHRRPPAAGRAGRRGPAGRRAAAGVVAVRRRPRRQPGRAPARAGRRAAPRCRRNPAGPHRPAVLPRPDLRPRSTTASSSSSPSPPCLSLLGARRLAAARPARPPRWKEHRDPLHARPARRTRRHRPAEGRRRPADGAPRRGRRRSGPPSLAAAFRRHGLPVVLVNVTGRAPGRTEAGSPARTPTADGGRARPRAGRAARRPPGDEADVGRLPRHRRSTTGCATPGVTQVVAHGRRDECGRGVDGPRRARARLPRRPRHRRDDRHGRRQARAQRARRSSRGSARRPRPPSCSPFSSRRPVRAAGRRRGADRARRVRAGRRGGMRHLG